VKLEAFIERVREQRPDIIDLHELADVSPHPWVTRHGTGAKTRTLMNIGGKGLWYERQQDDPCWRRVDDASEFDVLVNV
jgi:hypothetical protein